jgi:hypothetical protein
VVSEFTMSAPVTDRHAASGGPPPRRRRRPLVLGLSALILFVVVVVVVVVAVVVTWPTGDGADSAQPAGTIGPLDQDAIDGVTGDRAGDIGTTFTRTGGGLLLVGDRTLARYHDGGWWAYPTPPTSCCIEAALGPDGVVYARGGRVDGRPGDGLFELVDGAWVPLPETGDPPGEAWRVATDPGSGVLWVSTGGELHRWDGASWTRAPQLAALPSEPDGIGTSVGDIEVTSDGAVWASGLSGYSPELGGLARYDPASEGWERVQPWPGHGDVPAHVLTVGPDGDLWALLADWAPDWAEREAAGTPPWVVTALAHLDLDTGGWDLHELEAGTNPLALAAGADGAWIAHGWGSVPGDDDFPGVAHLVGDRWEPHLEDQTVSAVGLDDDGGVWVSRGGAIDRYVWDD